MPIRITLDQRLSARRMTARELAAEIGLSETQLSLFRSGKVKGIRFSTLARLCKALDCRPGDLLAIAEGRTSPLRPASECPVPGTARRRSAQGRTSPSAPTD
jgi:putative transcriptional regulator